MRQQETRGSAAPYFVKVFWNRNISTRPMFIIKLHCVAGFLINCMWCLQVQKLWSEAKCQHIDLEVVKQFFFPVPSCILHFRIFFSLSHKKSEKKFLKWRIHATGYEGLQASLSENWNYNVTAEFLSLSLLRKTPNNPTFQCCALPSKM